MGRLNTSNAPRVEMGTMVRVVVSLLVVILLGMTTVADAGGLRRGASPTGDLSRGSIIPRVGPIIPHGDNIVPNPPPERRVVPRRHVRPGFVWVTPPPVVVYAEPQVCTSPGYWAYQWVPTTYTESQWVPGSWRADGTWTEGHYEQRAYASGYYQPYWIPGQTYSC